MIRFFDVVVDEDDDDIGEDDFDEEEFDDFVGLLLDKVLFILDGFVIFFFLNVWNLIILSVYL